MEKVEQSGRRKVGEVMYVVERRRRRVGLNTDRRYLFVWISSLSPDIIVTSLDSLLKESIASLIC